jgi:fimbrial chaperone protein
MATTVWRSRIAAMWCALFAWASAQAGEFSVNPIRLDLGPAARSGALTVTNDGKIPLGFQLQAMEWVQDDQGKDQYLETRDLIFFPKILTVEPGQEGVVRVGIKAPIVPSEKTYRIFIEEMPGNAQRSDAKGTQIAFLIRFGAPVFVEPVKAEDGLEVTALKMAGGALTFQARNSGNRHQMVQAIELRGTDAAGKEVYATKLADRYILAHAAKPYTASIAAEPCSKLASLEIEIRTDKLAARQKMNVTQAMCPAK